MTLDVVVLLRCVSNESSFPSNFAFAVCRLEAYLVDCRILRDNAVVLLRCASNVQVLELPSY